MAALLSPSSIGGRVLQVQVRLDERIDIVDSTDLTALSVHTQLDPARTSHLLLGAGLAREADGAPPAHVWLGIEELARLTGMADDAGWRHGYDRMIEYAVSKGWVDDEGVAVLAHLDLAEA